MTAYDTNCVRVGWIISQHFGQTSSQYFTLLKMFMKNPDSLYIKFQSRFLSPVPIFKILLRKFDAFSKKKEMKIIKTQIFLWKTKKSLNCIGKHKVAFFTLNIVHRNTQG